MSSNTGTGGNPLFIVGMPRSGTKLLRDLLNQNPQVALLPEETHFLPFLIHKFGNPPEFGSDGISNLLQEIKATTFYHNMTARVRREINPAGLYELEAPLNWTKIFHSIWALWMEENEVDIWGDKTPGYLRHMKLLKEALPKAIFLHMIRDPRDYALSVRRSFGKSLLRAAERWRRQVEQGRTVGAKLGNDYFEVHYEALLNNPEETMKSVAAFVDVPFSHAMLTLEEPSENLGDATGAKGILRSNTEKYHEHLSEKEIRRIEEITFQPAVGLGYQMRFAAGMEPLPPVERIGLKLYDGLASIRMHVRQKGLLRGVRYFLMHYSKSSWRAWE